MPAPRKTPDEAVVREQLRREEELISSEAPRAGGEAPDPTPAESPPETASDEATRAEAASAEAAEEGADGAGEQGSEAEDPLVALERERDEYLALAQRAQADFENYRKRAAKEAAASGQRAKSGLVGELLPVVDNLERALQSATEGEEHLADGVRLVHSELVAVLARNGVEPFDPSGEKFDPSFHEALSTRPEEGAGSGVVLDVVEKGYRLNGSVLRPARVVVSG